MTPSKQTITTSGLSKANNDEIELKQIRATYRTTDKHLSGYSRTQFYIIMLYTMLFDS